MKKVLTLVLAAAVAVAFGGVAQAKEWKKVRVATEGAYAPWNSTDPSGKLVGFDIDLINEICKRQKLDCEITAHAWKGIIPGLTAGKYDCIIAGMQATNKRKKVIDFAAPYAKTPGSLLTLKSNSLAGYKGALDAVTLNEIDAKEKAALADLKKAMKGKIVGVQTSTTHSAFLDTFLKDTVTIRKYDTYENVVLDLKAGRIDAAQGSLAVWVPLMNKEDGKDLAIFGPAWTGDIFGLGNGIGVRKEDQDLRKILQAGIDSVQADGTLSKLALQWFGFDNSPK
ncbi:MAG: transporter substrate-binding domain-containing protein [Rhodospirillales bacterium]|nr:transporter substrate-binding domain-containing protein [Rhodospirillales bacterium]